MKEKELQATISTSRVGVDQINSTSCIQIDNIGSTMMINQNLKPMGSSRKEDEVNITWAMAWVAGSALTGGCSDTSPISDSSSAAERNSREWIRPRSPRRLRRGT
jgi:hypothetical protein